MTFASNAGPDRINDMSSSAMLAVHVKNFADIATAYGTWFAEAFLDSVCHRVTEYLARDGISVLTHGDHRFIVAGPLADHKFVDAMFAAAGSTPIIINDIPVLPALSVLDANAIFMVKPPVSRLDSAQYRTLMPVAVSTYNALVTKRMLLNFQPIRSADLDAELYCEGSAQITSGELGEGPIELGEVLPMIERLHLVRLLDHTVVHQTVAMLRLFPSSRLGCNISAQSAVGDERWSSLFSILQAEPRIAERFVIGITVTSSLPDLAAAQAFLRDLQKLGCQVAISGFGAGFISISEVAALAPDIVKIDGAFLRRYIGQIFGGDFLRSLNSLAACVASTVVLEGVDDEECLQLSRQIGGRWLQGHHIKAASVSIMELGFGIHHPACSLGLGAGPTKVPCTSQRSQLYHR